MKQDHHRAALRRIPARVPARAVLISGLALAVPLVATFVEPVATTEYDVLLWLLALVPAFLLAYYRGWRGAATALAIGMAVLVAAQAALLATGGSIERWPLLMAVVAFYIVLSLGIGVVTEMLHRARLDAERLSLVDDVTGLPNRRHVRLLLQQEFAAAQRGRVLSVVFFDLDGFKQYNDRYGHSAGDDALRAFSVALKRHTRAMNLTGRYGGDEFVSVLSTSDAMGATVFIGRVRSALYDMQPSRGRLTVSAGVAQFEGWMKSPDDLLVAADRALYEAKGAGGDATRIYDKIGAFAPSTHRRRRDMVR